MNQRFPNKEKLKSKKLIELLFSEGKTVKAFPLKMVYIKTSYQDAVQLKAGVSVSKRNFKKAVDRNRVKRLLRESYRLHKYSLIQNIDHQYVCMFLYLGRELPSFSFIEHKMEMVLRKFQEKEHITNSES